MKENYLDQNLQNSFENFLMNSGNLSQEEAATQVSEIQNNAMNLINSQDPEIQRRLDLIEEIDPSELNEELQYLITELSTNQYSVEDQMEISNALFNIFGFNITLDANQQVQINLVEPTIDDLEYEEDDDLYDDEVNFSETYNTQAAAPTAPQYNYAATNNATAATTNNQHDNTRLNKNIDYDDFDY